MIQRSPQPVEVQSDKVRFCDTTESWQTQLKACRLTLPELLEAVGLDHHDQADSGSEQLFELRVPRAYLQKIERGNPRDPLLLQVLPQKSEQLEVPGYSCDPLQEQQFSPVPGLIHKYRSRVLLIATQSCAIHCRYCFRRNFPYQNHRRSNALWHSALTYIREHPEVNEVILSGGDPMILTNESLHSLLNELDNISTIKRIRIHSRLLTTLPDRVDPELIKLLGSLHSSIIVVLHCNHPNELGEDVASAVKKLQTAGVRLYNQSVLLRAVNDLPETLAQLSESLFELAVQPYYLFALDKVSGAAHFDIPVAEAKNIYRELLALIPGFMAPKLVAEFAGESAKTPLDLGLESSARDGLR